MIRDRMKRNLAEIFLISGIVVFLILIIVTNIFHFNYRMNADIASDAILAKLIWTDKEIIPDTWYIANETRIICTPNIAAIFYGLTENMALSTGLACSLMTILILSGIIYFGRKADLKRVEIAMLAFLGLIISSNITILELLYLYASYYAIHVVILFFTLGIYIESIKQGRIKWIPAMTSIALALCLGMQGVRGILVLYGPLFGIEVIRSLYRIYCKVKSEKADWVISIWVCGLLFVSFLGTCFPFSVGQGLSRNIRKGMQKLFTVVIPNMGRAIGLGNVNIIGKTCFCIMILIAIYLLGDIGYRMLRRRKVDALEWAFLVICSSPVVTALMVAFTTIEDSERYYFMLVYVMALSVVLIWRRINNSWRILGGILLTVLVIVNIRGIYLPILQAEEPPATEAYAVGQYLQENNYFTAYATFENANTITVLTNGKVRVASVAAVDNWDICKWMTSTDWYVPNVPFEGQTAYVITESEMKDFKEFLQEHKDEIQFEAHIGKFLIYTSDYNFSVLERN